MNNNNKASEGQKKLLIVLLMLVVFFAAYRFAYQPLTKDTERLAEENAALEVEISDLKGKAANEAIYQAEIEAIHVSIGEILKQFGPGVTPEKSILFFINMAQAAQVQIPTISFGEPALLYTTSSLTNAEGMPYNQYAAAYNVAYSTSYEGLKTLIAYVNQFPEKMHLGTLTAAYSSETDSLSGNFSIEWYMLTGTGQQYRFEDMETIDIGNGNIFRSGSGAPDGDAGLDFNFDFGDMFGGSGTAEDEKDADDAGEVPAGNDGEDGKNEAGVDEKPDADDNDGADAGGNPDAGEDEEAGVDEKPDADDDDGTDAGGNPDGSGSDEADGDSDADDNGSAGEDENPDGEDNGGAD